jgi:NAD(P)-dependent dehydrogenase (short-subunit alcohol dehydrogenase family)
MAVRTISGTTVIVTGATSGIGLETARAFSRAGANVVLAGRRSERLEDLVAEVRGHGGKALAVQTDVAEEKQVNRLIERARSEFGSVDTLVNNAGVALSARFEDQSLDDFRRLMDINFWGTVYACKAAVPLMKAQRRGGVIINLSSILGRRGVPYETAYCASKFAVRGFSEALRVEVASANIDVCTVFPGLVETEMTSGEAAANQAGLPATAQVPMLPARELARVIVQLARFPQPEVIMAVDAQMIEFFNSVAPGALDFFLGQSVPFMEGMRQEGVRSTGNLYRDQPPADKPAPKPRRSSSRTKPAAGSN